MNKLKIGLWVAALSIFSLAAGLVLTPKSAPALNRYEIAQRQTVLLTLPDGQGSGVVMRRQSVDGTRLFVWTAAHVVEGFNEAEIGYFVRYGGHRVGKVSFKAKVLARDKARDIALLWLDADPSYFGAAKFDFEDGRVGDPQYHVGNFYGDAFDGSVSVGILSQVGIKPEDSNWPWATPLDQTTCAAIFGSSGGPVFNANTDAVEGLVVGGPVGKGFIEYVPAREILKWSKSVSISWAVVGKYCPSDAVLDELARQAVPPVVIDIFSVQ